MADLGLSLDDIQRLIFEFEEVLDTHHQNNGKKIKFKRSVNARSLFFEGISDKYTIHLGCSKDTNYGIVPEREKTYELLWGDLDKNEGYPHGKLFDTPEEVLDYLLCNFNE